ncbi:MAG: hypothetical protein R2690_12480 [Acidimicrobiales bacterium]
MAGPDGIEVGRRRTRLRPPMWLVAIVAAVALLAAVIGKLQAELAIAAAMLLVAVGDLLVARWGFAEVRSRLTFDGVAVVGEPASAVLEVHGARSRIWARVGWWQPAWFTVVPDTPDCSAWCPRTGACCGGSTSTSWRVAHSDCGRSVGATVTTCPWRCRSGRAPYRTRWNRSSCSRARSARPC